MSDRDLDRDHDIDHAVDQALDQALAHALDPGFLRRSAEHANACHQEELRRAVAALTHTRVGHVGGVQLVDLRRDGVELQWVDVTGAHRSRLRFRRPARTRQELADLLRDELHAGLC